jgi:hypothetical protein
VGNDWCQRRCCTAAVLHVNGVFAEEDEERALVLGADQGRVWSAERFRRSQDLVSMYLQVCDSTHCRRGCVHRHSYRNGSLDAYV